MFRRKANKIKSKLGTLGDNSGYLTCSMFVAHKKMPTYSIIPYPTFENAINALKCGEVSLVLVPSAYSLINRFIMDKKICVMKTFIEIIPPLVIVGKNFKKEGIMKDVTKIYLHEATISILNELKFESAPSICKVESNIEACKFLLDDEDINSCAITNLLCAKYFDLNIIKTLRDGVKMPWVIFSKN